MSLRAGVAWLDHVATARAPEQVTEPEVESVAPLGDIAARRRAVMAMGGEVA